MDARPEEQRYRIQATALRALQEAIEAVLVGLFEGISPNYYFSYYYSNIV